MSFIDTPQKRKDLQQALKDHQFYSGDVDGVLGPQSAAAIIKARSVFQIGPIGIPVVDTDLMRELGLLTIQDPVVVGAAAMKGIDLLSLLKLFGLANSLLKGNTTMTADQITGVLRALIAALSGFLVAKGIGSADFWTWISAGVTAIIPVVWTWVSNRPKTIVPLSQK